MMEIVHIVLSLLPRILQDNDIFLEERFVCQEIFPVLCFDVELLDDLLLVPFDGASGRVVGYAHEHPRERLAGADSGLIQQPNLAGSSN